MEEGDHRKIADLAKDLAALAEDHCTTDSYLADPTKALPARRRKLRTLLEASPYILARYTYTGESVNSLDGIESSSFTFQSSVTLTLSGFRSRWMTWRS